MTSCQEAGEVGGGGGMATGVGELVGGWGGGDIISMLAKVKSSWSERK